MQISPMFEKVLYDQGDQTECLNCMHRDSILHVIDEEVNDPADLPVHPVFDRLFVGLMASKPNDADSAACPYIFIDMPEKFSYASFCEDFGPLNLCSVHHFCEEVRATLDTWASKSVLVWGDNQESFTNAAFLLGAFLIIDLKMNPEDVILRFEAIADDLLAYRDVSPGQPNFALRLQDCWESLSKAKAFGWLDFSSGELSSFDPEEYEHYGSPLNADLHVIVPDKFVAMSGPVAFPGGANYRDTQTGWRQFSPRYALDILKDFDVQAVVRLNTPEYDKDILSAGGIAVADLFFEDCSTPPPEVVLKFMAIAERLQGPIAVHCKAGLGRTGTMIALYMMKHHGFTARQAIAWLRIVRPGSVIGGQQHFLCAQDKYMPRAREAFARTASSTTVTEGVSKGSGQAVVARGAAVARVEEEIANVSAAVDRLLCSNPARLVRAATPSRHPISATAPEERPSSATNPRGSHSSAYFSAGRATAPASRISDIRHSKDDSATITSAVPDPQCPMMMWAASMGANYRPCAAERHGNFSRSQSAGSALTGCSAGGGTNLFEGMAAAAEVAAAESLHAAEARALAQHVAAAAERRFTALTRHAAARM